MINTQSRIEEAQELIRQLRNLGVSNTVLEKCLAEVEATNEQLTNPKGKLNGYLIYLPSTSQNQLILNELGFNKFLVKKLHKGSVICLSGPDSNLLDEQVKGWYFTPNDSVSYGIRFDDVEETGVFSLPNYYFTGVQVVD